MIGTFSFDMFLFYCHQDKDTLRQELLVAKEALELAREKYGPMEGENRNYKHEMERIKEVCF